MSSPQAVSASSVPIATPASTQSQSQPQNVKPCCVCTDEKASRDECMLFAKTDNPIKECQTLVSKYKSCMAGFGFEIP